MRQPAAARKGAAAERLVRQVSRDHDETGEPIRIDMFEHIVEVIVIEMRIAHHGESEGADLAAQVCLKVGYGCGVHVAQVLRNVHFPRVHDEYILTSRKAREQADKDHSTDRSCAECEAGFQLQFLHRSSAILEV